MSYGPRIPDSKFARFRSKTPEGEGFVGVMIDEGRREPFMFSKKALQEYAEVTPGFDWRLYNQEGEQREIERTDPHMIDIVRRIGSRNASAPGCRIVVKRVPWESRNDWVIVDAEDVDDYSEKLVIHAKTFAFPN
jgi:hypothetical protein